MKKMVVVVVVVEQEQTAKYDAEGWGCEDELKEHTGEQIWGKSVETWDFWEMLDDNSVCEEENGDNDYKWEILDKLECLLLYSEDCNFQEM